MAVSAQLSPIQEFLLVYVLGDGQPGDRACPETVVHDHRLDMSDPEGLVLQGAELRAEITRHNERTMTVVSRSETTTITRCGVCPKEAAQPCAALRLLALPYAQHPAYRPEWLTARPGVTAIEPVPRQRSDELVPLPYQRMADLPPPGNPRRRALRDLGISISRSDFSDEELAQRGTALNKLAPPTD